LTVSMCLTGLLPAADSKRIAVVHTTDLYHPPADPDDHVDLAMLFALEEFDVRAVLFDTDYSKMKPEKAGDPAREPGFVPLAQLSFLVGQSMRCAAGPGTPLKTPADPATDQPRQGQAAITMLLETLRESPDPVVVTVLGSARIVAAAFNRDPQLLRRKIRSIVVNAGSSDEGPLEYNVQLDPKAYAQLFRSGLPVDWYPCSAKGTNPVTAFNSGEHNTFWRIGHQQLLRDLRQPLLGWFVHGFTGNMRGDILRALREQGRGATAGLTLSGNRNMWSTASLVVAAGRVLAKTPSGWRFEHPSKVPANAETELLALDPVTVTADDEGRTKWTPARGGSAVRIFRRVPGPRHDAAMAEALNALLRAVPVEQ